MVFTFQKKNVWLWGGGDNNCSSFYAQSIISFKFASCWFVRSVLSLFVSPINHLLYHLSLSPSLSLSLVFVSLSTLTQQKFAYDVGLVSTYSVHWHSTFFPIFADIEFKVSLLISLLYMPNKVLHSFCWNLHLTLVHCHSLFEIFLC